MKDAHAHVKASLSGELDTQTKLERLASLQAQNTAFKATTRHTMSFAGDLMKHGQGNTEDRDSTDAYGGGDW